jgi:hypothetical protein
MQYRGIKYKQDGLCNDTPYNKFKTFWFSSVALCRGLQYMMMQ